MQKAPVLRGPFLFGGHCGHRPLMWVNRTRRAGVLIGGWMLTKVSDKPAEDEMNIALSQAARIATAGLVFSAALPVQAQEIDIGRDSYERRCAVCHGLEGAGDAAVAELFAERPANLRKLAERNNGAFPFSQVYQSIDGRREIAAHGTTEMPIWGDIFAVEALPKTVHPGVTAQEIVQGRILALVYYIQTIQD